MWQRAQTLYLLLTAVCLSLTLVFPFASYFVEGESIQFGIFGVDKNPNSISSWFPYSIVIGVSLGLTLFSITQFKNRKRQLNLGKINYFLVLLIIVMLFLNTSSMAEKFGINSDTIVYGIGMYLPVAALPFLFLANRSIKKDEELVKSVERLR